MHKCGCKGTKNLVKSQTKSHIFCFFPSWDIKKAASLRVGLQPFIIRGVDYCA